MNTKRSNLLPLLFSLLLLTPFGLGPLAAEQTPALEISRITSDVYLHKSYRVLNKWGAVSSNGLIVVEGNRAFLVDTPWSEADTAQLYTWIKQQGFTLKGSVSTHSHEDRSAGIKWLKSQGVETYALTLSNEFLQRDGRETAQYEIAETPFELGEGAIEFYYAGAGHSKDNAVVWLAKSKLLFGGCLVRSLNSQNLGFTDEANIEQWSVSIEHLKQRYQQAKIVVPGHGSVGNLQLLEHTLGLITQHTRKNSN